MFNIRSSSQRVLTYSASVLGLYRYINKNTSSSISASRTIILPLLSVLVLLYLIFLFPRKPIITPQEFVVPFSLSCFYRSYMPALTYSNFKNYDVKTWWQKNAIYKLPNNWRSKDNQTMKFGQLIKYNTRNIFLEKSQDVVETTYFYLV